MSCSLNSCKLIVIFFLGAMFKEIATIKCYQCSTTYDKGCYSFNLSTKHLKECENRSGAAPVCRLISQVQFFTPDNDVSIIRECAYMHKENASCELSQFSNIHYSLSCECIEDGCNETDRARISNVVLFMTAIWMSVVK